MNKQGHRRGPQTGTSDSDLRRGLQTGTSCRTSDRAETVALVSTYTVHFYFLFALQKTHITNDSSFHPSDPSTQPEWKGVI